MNAIKNFIQDESGVTAMEYALIAGAIAAIVGVVFTNIGTQVKTKLNAVLVALGGTAV
ncbi:Flp family type IVb pilin [Duganella dendranthematis]|jgi:pilus assembly protein Flp/PilA|uniref:Flp family type IVb pilin n=1 Tax=Duganella dendranthematis TaxID=2728021 RepID=A0ABX6M5U0_9BURK|nr:Flp family type IVb pilin [Duganella dendranthematis]QJD89653.1 Flp family type IVb pilin [Duganella dendranthematis]